jgi:hypothetical protein
MSLNRLFGAEIKTENGGHSQQPSTVIFINRSEKQVRLLRIVVDYKIPSALYPKTMSDAAEVLFL